MVRVAGFEPAVFRSQAGRLTKLAHTHKNTAIFALIGARGSTRTSLAGHLEL